MSDVTPDLDLSPRTGPDDGPTPRRRRSRGRGLLVGIVILALLGGIVTLLIVQVQGSSLYYYNVDEAVAQRESLGDRDIRIQGTVVGDPVEQGNEDALVFDLAFGGESVSVRHLGPEPPPLFEAGVPSVIEGHFADDGSFVSERIVIKHSEEYREDNPDHVEDSPT
jgi:cytochrome c-type biogenesis protein CcmE